MSRPWLLLPYILSLACAIELDTVRAEQVFCKVNPATGQCQDDPDDEAFFLQVHKGPTGTPNPTTNLVAPQVVNGTSACNCVSINSQVECQAASEAKCLWVYYQGKMKCRGSCTCASINNGCNRTCMGIQDKARVCQSVFGCKWAGGLCNDYPLPTVRRVR
eukprot:gnl/TRDRNA2_/TRDRNA2_166033_c0_seq2.p1 gnl/TRDRNA2_/TRDRNA2_166033_c0~~gnl/TRDRNA2_/TRDRNA2_166033_c0_seq2.p1  ORF type:complete len:161 (+),score=1.68 gnl/TRDRNA2_/TRDRNA2_166033_c0_seq2:21-503(+)